MKDIDQLLKEQEHPKPGTADQKLIEALGQELPILLGPDFADKVMMKIAAGERRSQVRFWLIMGLGVLAFFALGFTGLVFFIGWENLAGLKNIAIYGVLIGLLVVFIQYLDHLLLPRVKLA